MARKRINTHKVRCHLILTLWVGIGLTGGACSRQDGLGIDMGSMRGNDSRQASTLPPDEVPKVDVEKETQEAESNQTEAVAGETTIGDRKDPASDELSIDPAGTITNRVADDSIYLDLGYDVMSQYHVGCTATTFSTGSGGYGAYTTACITAAQKYCQAVKGSTGAFIQEGTGDFLGIICVKAANLYNLDISVLTGLHEGCTLAQATANGGYSNACVAAAHRYCVNRTNGTGSVTQHNGALFGVTCTTGTSVSYEAAIDTLTLKHDLCTDANIAGAANHGYPGVCVAAVHRYCTDRGLIGGILTEYADAKGVVDCIK